MRMTLRSYMAQQEPDFNVLAGAGGVALGEAELIMKAVKHC